MTRSAGRRQAADREVLERPRRLDAVVGVGGHLPLAERIAFCAHAIRSGSRNRHSAGLRQSASGSSRNYTAGMLPAFFDSVLELIVKTSTDLPPDVRAAMRSRDDGRARAARGPRRR